MKRSYSALIENHLKKYNQMVFVGGPRQVGKTTITKCQLSAPSHLYLNWDIDEDRAKILQPSSGLLSMLASHRTLSESESIIVFDELHKYKNWKNYLKGFYDACQGSHKIIVTGSASLDAYKKGGDSLMGRYFSYTIHPLSVREVARPLGFVDGAGAIGLPIEIDETTFKTLWKFGGFPEPFLKQEDSFYNQWIRLKKQQLCRQDVFDVHPINDMPQFELLVHLLTLQSGGLLNHTSLSKHIRVSHNSIRRWIDILDIFYYCFKIYPWSRNISRSLLKEPKVYLWDWSMVQDEGSRFENFVASHLLKAVSFWNESGLGDYGLYFIRTKDQKEVDFLVTQNDTPWFLVEAKHSCKGSISKALMDFHEILGTQHAFQVIYDLPYVDKSCFDVHTPTIVPAKTFLSQLV